MRLNVTNKTLINVGLVTLLTTGIIANVNGNPEFIMAQEKGSQVEFEESYLDIDNYGFSRDKFDSTDLENLYDLDYSLYKEEDTVESLERNKEYDNLISEKNQIQREIEARRKEEELLRAEQQKKIALASELQESPIYSGGIGSSVLPSRVNQFTSIINKWSQRYNLDPGIVTAIISQESSGNDKQSTGAAWGLMQIEDTVLNEFYKFGREVFKEDWDKYDRLDAEKNVAFGCYRLRQNLDHYGGDYEKAIQAYNFSHYSLDKLIAGVGDSWKQNRKDIAHYNGHYSRTGSTRYGDPNYIENVMRYYN